MKKNKYFGFDEDHIILVDDILIECNDLKAKKDAEIELAKQRDIAIDKIKTMILDFFKPLGYHNPTHNVMNYLNTSRAANRIVHSLTKCGFVPDDLVKDAAESIIDDCIEAIKYYNILTNFTALYNNNEKLKKNFLDVIKSTSGITTKLSDNLDIKVDDKYEYQDFESAIMDDKSGDREIIEIIKSVMFNILSQI